MTLRTAFALAVVITGCGGSTPSNPTADAPTTKHDARPIDAKPDAPGVYDFGCGGNTACPLNTDCCAMPGATTSFSCVAPASCPMADQIKCDGPDECGGTAPVCCGVDVPDGSGNFPMCGVSSLGTSCTSAAACPTHLGGNCNDTTKVVICHVAADCAGDPQNNKCCTFMSGGASLTFCIDATTAQLGGGTCHP